MPNPKTMPSAEYLRACLDYNPETGELRWKQRPREHFQLERIWKKWNSTMPETLAGFCAIESGCRIGLAGSRTTYATQRVIWKWMTGEEPKNIIDHIDGDFCNNRWNNLREATHTENQYNRARNNKTKYKSPYPGAYYVPRKNYWLSYIRINKTRQFLGCFPTAEEAAAAYKAAARKRSGKFFPFRKKRRAYRP